MCLSDHLHCRWHLALPAPVACMRVILATWPLKFREVKAWKPCGRWRRWGRRKEDVSPASFLAVKQMNSPLQGCGCPVCNLPHNLRFPASVPAKLCYSLLERLFGIPPEVQPVSDFSAFITPDRMRTLDWCVCECECLVWLALSFLHHRNSPVVHLGLTGADWVQVLLDCRCHLKIAFIPLETQGQIRNWLFFLRGFEKLPLT